MSDEVFKAFIGGLPYDALASDVEAILNHCQFTPEEIRKMEIHLVHDRESGQFKGFCYVTFPNEEQLNRAVSDLNNVKYGERVLKVNRAQQRDRGDRGGRGGSRGGFGGDRGRGGGGGGRGRGGRGGDRDRFHDAPRGGFGSGGGGGGGRYRQRKESDEFGGSQHEDGHHQPRHRRPSHNQESEAPSGPPAERPRLNLKPRTTDASEIEARKRKEEEETKKRQEKLFG